MGMKTTIIAISIAAAFAFTSMPAEARILKNTKNTVGWSFNKKTKRWKAIKKSTPSSRKKYLRNQLRKHRREMGW